MKPLTSRMSDNEGIEDADDDDAGRRGEPDAKLDRDAICIVAPRPRKSGANPRYETSQPESATHCRIQITKPDITTVNASPPPNTRLWNT